MNLQDTYRLLTDPLTEESSANELFDMFDELAKLVVLLDDAATARRTLKKAIDQMEWHKATGAYTEAIDALFEACE